LQDKELNIEGIKLHYAEWNNGPQSGSKNVLLIHGLTASNREFTGLGNYLSREGFRVIAPDLRGRGLSSKPAHGYGIHFHVADLLTLLDSLGLDSVSVVGHSLGGAIGLYMAALFPARVRKLVVVDFGIRIPADTLQAISASVNRLGQVYPSMDAYLDMCKRMPYFKWGDFWDAFYRYDAEVRPDGTVVSRASKSGIQEEAANVATLNSEILAPMIRAPTLFLRATEGLLGPDRGLLLPREEADRLLNLITGSQVKEIPKTNHFTIILSPELETSISDFLKKD
jgi:pimeloyl-ACP methyl ester carboxylesterase